jgi:hypothetical protein
MFLSRKRFLHDLQRAEEVGFLSGRLYEIDGFGRNPSAVAEKIREVRALPGSEYERRYPKELDTERM